MKKVKKYELIDLQNAGWWDYTHEDPLTEEEIKELFIEYAYRDNLVEDWGKDFIHSEDFDLPFISEIWGVEFKEVA